jgi:hypothetical protein
MKLRALFLMGMLFSALANAQEEPEITEDGLVRVMSTPKAGVYRLPGATFDQYRGVLIGPISVSYSKSWERQNAKVSKKDRDKIRFDMARTFRAELIRELVERGNFVLAKSPAPDVLQVDGSVLNLFVTAPIAGTEPLERTMIKSAGSMKVVVELKDSVSNVIVTRIISYETAPEHLQLQPATQISNLADFRLGFENSSRYTHEAINVAKASKREDQSVIRSEN